VTAPRALGQGELLQERDGHAAGRGFDAGEIEALRTKIAQAAAGSAVNQVREPPRSKLQRGAHGGSAEGREAAGCVGKRHIA
jgi:hypothetical protein